MVIVAKFASVCPCCGMRLSVGDKVEWSKGEKARHVSCSAPVIAQTSVSARRTPMGSGHGRAATVKGYSSYCTANPSCGCYDCAS
jgi:hypothetical protein